MKCPCCGGQFAPNRASVDLNTNTFVCEAGQVKLTAQQAELAYALLERTPAVVSYDTLMSRMWSCAPPEAPITTIKVQTMKLRQKIEPFGYAIQVVRERGYRLLNLREPAYAA